MICGLLERFGGYTLGTLLAEDTELMRLVNIESLGRPPEQQTPGV